MADLNWSKSTTLGVQKMANKVCPYCHTDRDGYVQKLPREGFGNASIHWHHPAFGGWMLHFFGKHRAEAKIKINFCPMCGRNLKDGA